MRMRGCLLGLLFVVSMGGAAASSAEPFRILYAEQVAVGKPQLARQLALHAYGREYDLRIESNDALARRLPLAALEGKSLYRGTLGGVTGSWVRLTQVDGELFGAFWDGTDLYSVAPGRDVEPFL